MDTSTCEARLKHGRMLHNVRKFPALVSQFFHMRTELFLQHFGELLGVEAYWLRCEWRARGSTHAHFFLWLKDAPNLEFLDAFTWQVCMEMFGQEEEQVVDDEQLDAVVERLNEEALKQLEDPKSEMSKAVQYWTGLCSRWNTAWLTHDPNHPMPDYPKGEHPCSKPHQPKQDVQQFTRRSVADILNRSNRHDNHTNSYCYRIDKHGRKF